MKLPLAVTGAFGSFQRASEHLASHKHLKIPGNLQPQRMCCLHSGPVQAQVRGCRAEAQKMLKLWLWRWWQGSFQPFLGTPSHLFTALCYSAWSYTAEQPCNPTKTHREGVRSNTGLTTHPAAQLPSTEGAKPSWRSSVTIPLLDPCCALWIPLPSLVSHALSPAISAPRASSQC